MQLMIFQEFVVVLYMRIPVVVLLLESHPPTASSCPCIETIVEREYGVSASWIHTLGSLANDKVFSRDNRDCGLQVLRRAASEQVNTDLDLQLWSQPPSM